MDETPEIFISFRSISYKPIHNKFLKLKILPIIVWKWFTRELFLNKRNLAFELREPQFALRQKLALTIFLGPWIALCKHQVSNRHGISNKKVVRHQNIRKNSKLGKILKYFSLKFISINWNLFLKLFVSGVEFLNYDLYLNASASFLP